MTNRRGKTTFVLVVPRFEDIFHSYYAGEIIRGVSFSASRLNIDFIIHITDRKDHKNWLDSNLVDRNYVDGIIFADIDNDLGPVKLALRRGMPCMVLNNILEEPINYVAIDNKKAAYEVTESLIKLGHKNIATIAGDVSTQAGLMRLEGFQNAMSDHKIKVPRTHITFGDFLRTPAKKAAEKLLALKDRPTAVFAASDVMALELISVAREMKIKVPEELSVIGFDDNPLSTVGKVQLSTVFQPLVEMGRLGAENLYQITRGKMKLPVKEILPTKTVSRSTTAKVPAA
jgi:LacI family transcriptional regulator